MRANDQQSTAPILHGAYVLLDERGSDDVPELAARLGLRNEFEPGRGPDTIAFLRRVSATPGDLPDDTLLGTQAIVHVASAAAEPIAEFCSTVTHRGVLGGVLRPMRYTSGAMFDYAYAHRVLQGPGESMPNAFLVPMSKTAAWWEKDWMERQTYFLPRYGRDGMEAEGHALVAEAGIAALLRRTYTAESPPARDGAYDFVTYFECADADVPTFHDVCAALRDVERNPEWAFVREGPTWQGRRVATFDELFAERRA